MLYSQICDNLAIDPHPHACRVIDGKISGSCPKSQIIRQKRPLTVPVYEPLSNLSSGGRETQKTYSMKVVRVVDLDIRNYCSIVDRDLVQRVRAGSPSI